jgi:hypothetical protein
MSEKAPLVLKEGRLCRILILANGVGGAAVDDGDAHGRGRGAV